ncbi:MAG: hypothetical protein P1V51_05650 [Deltaproteobacteria bacterium]|nr:hypothetical protein [Deltaproteobacteria bacterium]
MKTIRKLLSRLSSERGQAATEYAIMSAYLLAAGLVASPFVMRFMPEMLNAFQIYVDGFYFVFSLPIP